MIELAPTGSAGDATTGRTEVAQRWTGRHTWRLRYAAVCALLTGLAFNSSSGRTVQDTKLDLVVDPLSFLSHSLHLWDPVGFAGQLQEQAYGYLFPMGPFFAAGHLLHLPAWTVQRLWWSLILCTAFLGVVRLAERLDIGSPLTRLIGGLAFALSPHLLTVLGPLSAEALPMSLAAWVVAPLVRGSRSGSPRRAAMLSGLAVLAMGGINAGLDLAALVPAVLWLVTRRPDPRVRRLTAWWLLAVTLACFWWLVPLLLLGRYSPPFLQYIESASTTTSVTSLTETLRGTSDWVAYLPGNGWHAGWVLLTEPAVILNIAVVVAVGLAALCLRRTPHRLWLVLMLLVGVAVIASGHVASVDGALAHPVRTALDGALAPLRNVHKFDVLIRLPLALGVAALLDIVPWGGTDTERFASRSVVVAVVVVALAGSGAPLLSLQLAPDGSFVAVPPYWSQAATWLHDNDPVGRTLVLPAARFGQYDWGSTGDNALQPLASAPWEIRDAIPLVPVAHIRLLDAIEQRLAAGEPSAGLAEFLARAGIRHLLVQNDLDYSASGTPRPILVNQALAGSPGLHLVKTYGGQVGGVGGDQLVIDQDLQLFYPALQIWSIDATGDPRVTTAPTADVPVVSGDPAALLDLTDAGALADAPSVLTSDGPVPAGLGPGVLTDTLRRRETNFGGPAGVSSSATLTPQDPLRLPDPQRDYELPGGAAHVATARLVGLAALAASSSASDAGAFGGPDPSAQPFAALDGDPTTAWRPDPGESPLGQWLQLGFAAPTDVTGLTVRLPEGSTVTGLTVTTDAGSRTDAVGGAGSQALATPTGDTRSLRVTVSGLSRTGPGSQRVGIAELAVPGLHAGRPIALPSDLPGTAAPALIDLSAPVGARPSCLVLEARALCARGLGQQGEESAGLDRIFTTPAASSYDVSAWATPRAGPALTALLAASSRPLISASASSSAVPDPLGSPAAAVDGDFGTGWVADPQDPAPTLRLRWSGKRTLDSLRLVSDTYLAATRPQQVQITSPAGTRTAPVAADGTVQFTPLRTDRLDLLLTSQSLRSTYDPTTHVFAQLGLGVSEVLVPGLHPTSRTTADTRPVTLACGSTPSITIDGTDLRTQVRTTVGALRDLRPMPLSVCGSASASLPAGSHEVQAPSTSVWSPTRVLLSGPGGSALAGAVTPAVPATPTSWGATSRRVLVGARAASTLLVVHENANAGWQATLAGHRLRAVTVDGWQQGYLVPAGPAATVHLDFTPDRTYRLGLVAGLLMALVLVAGAIWPARRSIAPGPGRAWTGRIAVPVAGVATLVLVGGWVGLVVALTAALGVALTVVMAGPGLRRVGRLDGARLVPAVAAAMAYLICGSAVAVGHWGAPHYLASAAALQVGCLIALAAVIIGPDGAGWAGRLTTWRRAPQAPTPEPEPGRDQGPGSEPLPAGDPGDSETT